MFSCGPCRAVVNGTFTGQMLILWDGRLLEWRREIQPGDSLPWRVVVEGSAESCCSCGTETVREPRGKGDDSRWKPLPEYCYMTGEGS